MEEVKNNTEKEAPQGPPQVNVNVQAPDTSEETRRQTSTIVTILLLIFLFPIGIIVMWFYPKWKAWVKLLITGCGCFPFIFALLAIMGVGFLSAFNPKAQLDKAKCVNACETSPAKKICVSECMSKFSDGKIEVSPTIPSYQIQ